MNIHEYGAGGSRRGRQISGSKKSPNTEFAVTSHPRIQELGNGNGEEMNEQALAFLQVSITDFHSQ